MEETGPTAMMCDNAVPLAALTEPKADLLRSMLTGCPADKNYYPLLTLPDITPETHEAVERLLASKVGDKSLLRFHFEETEVKDIKWAKRLQVVFVPAQDAPPIALEFVKYVKYVTKKLVDRHLTQHEDPLARKMRDLLNANPDWQQMKRKEATAVLCHCTLSVPSPELLKELSAQPLLNRITLDVRLGVYNQVKDEKLGYADAEMVSLGINELELVRSFCTRQFDTLDFEDMIDKSNPVAFTFKVGSYANFSVSITGWDDKELSASSYGADKTSRAEQKRVAAACGELLHVSCIGSRIAHWGYSWHKYDNYFGIYYRMMGRSKENDATDREATKTEVKKWMAVHYCVDNASCGGFRFTLTSWSSLNSLTSIWQQMNPAARMQFLRANLDPSVPSVKWFGSVLPHLARKVLEDAEERSDSGAEDSSDSDC